MRVLYWFVPVGVHTICCSISRPIRVRTTMAPGALRECVVLTNHREFDREREMGVIERHIYIQRMIERE